MATKKRRRKRKRGAGVIVLVLFLAAAGYIAFIAVTQPERLTAGLFNKDAAPALAEAAEPSGEPTDEPGDNIAAADITGNDTDNPYARFTFYIGDKLADYERYQAEHPEFDAETTVWRVNAGLNRPFFTDAETTTDANPLLVNPYHRLPEDFTPAALEVVDDYGRQATPETINAFRQMREGAIQAGLDIAVQSAYRTVAYQQGLYDRAGGDGSVARPTYSEHHTGRALDLWGPDGLLDERTPSETGRWVAAHAHEYGFIIRYTAENQDITGYIPEPWHITYVGTGIANEMREAGIGSLEEYVARNPQAKLP